MWLLWHAYLVVGIGTVMAILFPLSQSDEVAGTEAIPRDAHVPSRRVGIHDARDIDTLFMDATRDPVEAIEPRLVCKHDRNAAGTLKPKVAKW